MHRESNAISYDMERERQKMKTTTLEEENVNFYIFIKLSESIQRSSRMQTFSVNRRICDIHTWPD